MVSSSTKPAFMPVFIIPRPKGFVNIKASPGLAPPLVITLSGCTLPITDKPYLGSSSSTVCPPIITAPASFTLSPPPFRISISISIGKHSGKHTTFRAVTDTYHSINIAKSIGCRHCPNSYGSSTRV